MSNEESLSKEEKRRKIEEMVEEYGKNHPENRYKYYEDYRDQKLKDVFPEFSKILSDYDKEEIDKKECERRVEELFRKHGFHRSV